MTDPPADLARDDAPPPRRGRLSPPVVVAAALAVVLAVAAAVVTLSSGDGDDAAARDPATSTSVRRSTTSTAPTTTTTVSPTTTSTAPSPPPTTAAPAAPPPPPAPAPELGGALCIGDSVMLGASPQYLNVLGMCGSVDAEQSRQFSSARAAVAAHAPYPAAVVIHLGNNGTVDRGDVDAVLTELARVPRVVLVTVQLRGTRSWEGPANGEIRAAADRFPNVAVADWKAASDGHPEYTRDDGIHLAPAGGGPYAATIAAAR